MISLVCSASDMCNADVDFADAPPPVDTPRGQNASTNGGTGALLVPVLFGNDAAAACVIRAGAPTTLRSVDALLAGLATTARRRLARRPAARRGTACIDAFI
ncbi:hypothetical protein WI664_15050 [Vibrio cholerae]